MRNRNKLWDYARAIYPLPAIKLEDAATALGAANLKALVERAKQRVEGAEQSLTQLEQEMQELGESKKCSELYVSEIRAEVAENELIQANSLALVEMLKLLQTEAPVAKFVLPQFRSPAHFKVGDEVMIDVSIDQGDLIKIAKYDWVSAKILCTDELLCHSNIPWTESGSNGGHYFKTEDGGQVFKRSDFFGLRKMLEKGDDPDFLALIPKDLATKILNGTVEPTSYKEIVRQRPQVIQQAMRILAKAPGYRQRMKLVANRYGIAI